MIAKTDVVPVRPEGDGWFLLSSHFTKGEVCICGTFPQNADFYNRSPVVCPNCGAHSSCFKPCAYLYNEWRRDNPVTVRVRQWYGLYKSSVKYVYERDITYGGWKELEACSDLFSKGK